MAGRAPEGCATCHALSSEVWLFHVTPLLTMMQPVGGAGAFAGDPLCVCTADGQPAVGVSARLLAHCRCQLFIEFELAS